MNIYTVSFIWFVSVKQTDLADVSRDRSSSAVFPVFMWLTFPFLCSSPVSEYRSQQVIEHTPKSCCANDAFSHFKSNRIFGHYSTSRVKLKSFHRSQKSPLVSIIAKQFQHAVQFCGTLFVVSVVSKLLYSSSTWWVIVAQYKKKLQEVSRPLLPKVLQTATFSCWSTVPSLYILRINKYSKILNSLNGLGSNWVITDHSIRSSISNTCTALNQSQWSQYGTEICNIS